FEAFGDVPIVQALADNIASFSVHFVLNLFDGVRESFERAVTPFISSLHKHVSAQLAINNLGWIVNSEEVHLGNCQRHPIVLRLPTPGENTKLSTIADLEAMVRGTAAPGPD